MLEEFYKQPTLPGVAAASAKEEIPEFIGPYKIESLLSKGGMSLLYLGLHPETHTPLAIKVLSPKLAEDPQIVKQFLKEAEIIELADHPQIVKLYGHGKWENGLYIAMEFIQGISLRQFIIQHSLSLRRALEIVLNVAYALLHLHTHGVIHRDLKPENILMMENGSVKVIDFGIAQLAVDKSKKTKAKKGGLIGTPNYMSPEQKEDPGAVTFASDIYSLGVIAYELIVGKLSFGYIRMELVSAPLRKILEKALQPDPKNRYQDIVDFIAAISQYLKSSELQQGLQGNAESQEIWDSLKEKQKTLFAFVPKWPHLEIGFSHTAADFWPGIYYDFFDLNNQYSLIFCGEAAESHLSSCLDSAVLSGIVRTMVKKIYLRQAQNFDPLVFANELNELLAQEALSPFALGMLFLDRQKDQFFYISCGYGPLWHLSGESSEPRLHLSQNPLLGKTRATLVEVSDNWHEGDLLLFHSPLSQTFLTQTEPHLRSFIFEEKQYSVQVQAEAFLNAVSKLSEKEALSKPMLAITIRRIS